MIFYPSLLAASGIVEGIKGAVERTELWTQLIQNKIRWTWNSQVEIIVPFSISAAAEAFSRALKSFTLTFSFSKIAEKNLFMMKSLALLKNVAYSQITNMASGLIGQFIHKWLKLLTTLHVQLTIS